MLWVAPPIRMDEIESIKQGHCAAFGRAGGLLAGRFHDAWRFA
jgi:aconitase B